MQRTGQFNASMRYLQIVILCYVFVISITIAVQISTARVCCNIAAIQANRRYILQYIIVIRNR